MKRLPNFLKTTGLENGAMRSRSKRSPGQGFLAKGEKALVTMIQCKVITNVSFLKNVIHMLS